MSFNIKPSETFNANSNVTIDSFGIVGKYTNSFNTFIYENGTMTDFPTSLSQTNYAFDKVGDTYIAIQTNYAQNIYHSKDAKTWSAVSLSQFGSFSWIYDINISVVNNTAFITFYDMMSGCYILRSTDGSIWNLVHYIPNSQAPKTIAYTNGKYLANIPNTYDAIFSIDGITWVQQYGIMPTAYGSVYAAENKFLMIGNDNMSQQGFFSENGLTWSYLGGGYYGKIKQFDGINYMWGGGTYFSKITWNSSQNWFVRDIAGLSGIGMAYSGYSFAVIGNKVYFGSNQDAIRVSTIKYDGGMGMANYDMVGQAGAFIAYQSTLTKTLKQFIQDLSK